MFLLRTLVRYVLRSQTNVKCYTTVESIENKMENPLVTVKQGKLKGSVKRLLNGKTYYSFKGVPYAQPPVGDLRFKAPLPPLPWDGIKEAINHGPVCPQYNMTTTQLIEGSEDCLFLNVYTKALDFNSKIPVMVYVHGGAFSSGSGDADILGPEFLLQHDVIIVTINYRLEVLGFLCLDTPEVPGNAGMKDQVAALRWVKENIAQFGGDPGNVTLFGESAGAGSVTHHMLSPMSKGLFHRAIAQSGVCLQDWAIVDGAKERAFRAGKVLGKDTNNTKELLDFFESIPAIDFNRMSLRTRSQDEKYRGLPMLFVPVVEKKFHGVESFLTENPIDILMSGKINKVPLLIGYNSAEGLLMLEDQFKKLEVMNNKPSYYVPREIARKISQEQMEDFGARIKSFYVGNKELSKDTAQEIVDIQTDLHFSYHSHRFAHLYHSYAPVYMYRFNYMTGLSFLTNMLTNLQVKGTCHADDVFYLFYSELIKEPYQEDQKARDIVFQLTKFWTDFARTGNPTPNTCEVEWKRYTSAGKEYLALEDDLRIRHYADKDRMEFWNKVYCDAGLPYITKSAI